ncbi:MAG: formylglycine-generating enzyme family protein [Kiritimatiellae bacterium]|nr:formylglycine-generating enzyme family protein [Kiritimatiellia bacterium]
MNSKWFLICIASMWSMVSCAANPIVSDVTAKQRYPWNGMVDIDYTITGDATGMSLEVSVEDVQNGKTYTPTKFLSALPVSEGRHRITWSTEAEGVTIVSTNVAVMLSIVKPDPGAATNVLYYVVDLSGGPTAANYPVTTLTAPPSTTWPDEYKTTKLVLRRIEPGEIPTHDARITKPFYIGVFEVTVAQWNLVMSSEINPDATDKRAKDGLSYNDIRGANAGAGWPNSSSVDERSFLGKLREKAGIYFDLPTEAKWEYACRAGTTSKYNNGGDTETDLSILGRWLGNINDGRGGYCSRVTVVGSYAPNAWGLFDMHGNVEEWCLDYYDYYKYPCVGDDPQGIASSDRRVARGSAYGYQDGCASSYRAGYSAAAKGWSGNGGCRLVCPAGL